MPQKDPKIEAFESVYTALKALNQQERQEIVASVFALLGSAPLPTQAVTTSTTTLQTQPGTTTVLRPKGLMEVVQERHPSTNAQRIAVFAYYRERHENIARFSRDDLKAYFGRAHLMPPTNYDRDFITALQRGWVHEDGNESYITTKGIEAVETSFEGERASGWPARSPKKAKSAKRAKSAKPQQSRKTTSKAR